MDFHVVDRCRNSVKTMPQGVAEHFVSDWRSDNAQRMLKYLRKNRYWIKCRCEIVMHPVFDPGTRRLFLRQNPRQKSAHQKPCPFCNRSTPKTLCTVVNEQTLKRRGLSRLLLNIKKDVASHEPKAMATHQHDAQRSTEQYGVLFGFLFELYESLGIHRYPNPVLGRNVTWDDIYDRLQETPYSNFCWCPSKKIRGGLVALNQRICREWHVPGRVGEGIILGLLNKVPGDEEPFSIDKFPGDRFPVRGLSIACHQIYIAGGTGPYLMLAVCTANTDTPRQYAVPVLNRMIMQAVTSHRCLIPVDSDHERRIIKLLVRHRIPFEKPLFPEGEFKPNLILPGAYIIDARGMKDDQHERDQRHLYQRMKRYYHLPMLCYHANRNETIEAFESQLLAFLKEQRAEGRAP